MTNAYIAKESDVSIKTVEKIMVINCDQDIMRATARRIELAIIGPVSTHFCDLDYDGSAATEQIKKLLTDIEHLRAENNRYAKIIDKYLE